MYFRLLLFLLIFALSRPAWPQNGAPDNTMNGKFLYEDIAGCARCHGSDGKGKVKGLDFDTSLLPDFTDCSFNAIEPRSEWIEVVAEGGLESGHSDVMPAYGEALTPGQIAAIVDYLKSLCADSGWPDGELNFQRPQLTTKAYPENNLVLAAAYPFERKEATLSALIYQRRLGKRSELDAKVPFIFESGASSARGIGDLDIGFKHVMVDHATSSSIFTGGLGVTLPTGNTAIGTGEGMWKIVPYLAFGKGFDAFFIQSSLKLEASLQKTADQNRLFFDLAVTRPLTWKKKSFFPMLEINTLQNLSSGKTTVLLTPQVYLGFIEHGHIALSIGWQTPVAGERPFDARLMAFLLWQYDEVGLWW